jgi:hypothetical protein
MSTVEPLPPSSVDSPAQPRKRLRFRLRTILIATSLLCVMLAGLAWWRERARQQAEWARQVASAGGMVWYDYQFAEQPDGTHSLDDPQESPYPKFLVDLVGVDFLHSPRGLTTPPKHDENRDTFPKELLLEALAARRQYYMLQINSLTLRTDDLDQIAAQQELEHLSLDSLLLPEHDLSPLADLQSLNVLSLQRTPLTQCDLAPLGELSAWRCC